MYTENQTGLQKRMLKEESFGSFPAGAGSAKEEKEEKIYAPPSEEDI